MPFTYPLMLDVRDRLVVVIGAGSVAARKARTLIECGATRVRVVAPRFGDSIPAGVERVNDAYDPRYLEGAALVFAATDSPDVNETVVRDARARGILVNRSDDAPAGDFATPAMLRDGEVTVTVSTGGSPALAAAIRDDLRRKLDARHVEMSRAMQSLRQFVLGASADPAVRRSVLRDLAGEDAVAMLDKQGVESLRAWLEGRHDIHL